MWRWARQPTAKAERLPRVGASWRKAQQKGPWERWATSCVGWPGPRLHGPCGRGPCPLRVTPAAGQGGRSLSQPPSSVSQRVVPAPRHQPRNLVPVRPRPRSPRRARQTLPPAKEPPPGVEEPTVSPPPRHGLPGRRHSASLRPRTEPSSACDSEVEPLTPANLKRADLFCQIEIGRSLISGGGSPACLCWGPAGVGEVGRCNSSTVAAQGHVWGQPPTTQCSTPLTGSP